MINGLIANAGKISRDLAIACIAIYVVVWATDKLVTTFNPSGFHDEIVRAEQRSKDLIAVEIEAERAISAAEHREVMGAVSRIDERSKRIETKMDTLLEKKTAVLFAPRKGVN